MIEMTPGAQMRLDNYLEELRRVLMGSPAVDLADVERDVRDHIDAALSQQARPVEEPVLERVLRDLGSPAQWLPGEARPWYRKSRAEWLDLCRQHANNANRQFFDFLKDRIANGSESYRLAYLSQLVLALGWCAFSLGRGDDAIFIPCVATLVSFILSRASLSLFGAENLSSGQKWLLYPALVAVYIPLLAVLLFGAATVAGTAILVQAELQSAPLAQRQQPLSPVTMVYVTIAVAGVNWFLVGLLLVVFPQTVRNILHPFADRLTRWPGYGLVAIGLLLSLGGLAFVG